MNPPKPKPTDIMLQMTGGFQVSQAVYVVAKLDLPTMLDEAGGPLTVSELAERSGAQSQPLRRLLRTLASMGLFVLDGDRVSLTPLGATLSRNADDSVHAVALMWMETHYAPFGDLLHTLRTGEPAADHYLGKPFFDWVTESPDRTRQFSDAMAAVTNGFRTGMFDDYALPAGELVADIGGADGSVLAELIKDLPDRRGIVFDLPAVTPAARSNIAARELDGRVEVVAGDFFDSVPVADIYVLSYILHDWDDAAAVSLLQSAAKAGGPGARVLIVEAVMPDGDEPHVAKTIDLTMLAMGSGKERTRAEYELLLNAAGISIDRVVSTPTPYSIIEATIG
ncbi:methyltransferase [Streptomyces sp. NL15-2K]|uniref:methyltransferase n=1 Tax=Streptomyces sp. NL15-2K TaxID=376149 RepID=UPI000F55EEA4|nr:MULTISPECIES: methyltransferase [Actinomycetes]WKX11292.1 methyltransferase [Kutzneria buriramensis]GCB47291.1 O-methyltransferase [Streptomyces sp. NL15-2K]